MDASVSIAVFISLEIRVTGQTTKGGQPSSAARVIVFSLTLTVASPQKVAILASWFVQALLGARATTVESHGSVVTLLVSVHRDPLVARQTVNGGHVLAFTLLHIVARAATQLSQVRTVSINLIAYVLGAPNALVAVRTDFTVSVYSST